MKGGIRYDEEENGFFAIVHTWDKMLGSVSEGHALIADKAAQMTRLFVQRIIQGARAQREKNPVKAHEMLDMLGAAVHGDRGEFTAAGELLQEALQIAKRIENPILLGTLLTSMGLIAEKAGHFGQAVQLTRDGIELCQQASHLLGEATGWRNLGTLYMSVGEIKLAQESLKQALALCRVQSQKMISSRKVGFFNLLRERRRSSEFGVRSSGFGIRDSGFGIRDSGFGIRGSRRRDSGKDFWRPLSHLKICFIIEELIMRRKTFINTRLSVICWGFGC